MTTLKELRADCLEVEHQIGVLLMDFQNKHGIAVSNIGLLPLYSMGISLPRLVVELEVKLK